MPARYHLRRWIALLSLAALLLAVLTPGASGIAPAILVPIWLFLELLVVVSNCRNTDDPEPGAFPWISLAASRAPPVQ